MDTLQQIAFCFNYAAKWLQVLQAELELDEDAKASMDNRTKLQSLSETRWASSVNAQYTFRSAFTVTVSALEYLEADGGGKAWSYVLSIQRFETSSSY